MRTQPRPADYGFLFDNVPGVFVSLLPPTRETPCYTVRLWIWNYPGLTREGATPTLDGALDLVRNTLVATQWATPGAF